MSRRIIRPRWLQAAAWTLQVLLIGQAVLATVAIARGQGPARPGLFLAHLAVAVALLSVHGPWRRRTGAPTSHDVRLAVAAAIGVVVQRWLVATWRSGSV